MPYIYKITNQINQKVYVGKTTKTIEKRWNEHISDSQRENICNRPLYKAFHKYGIENFKIEMLEECDVNILSEREIYWIEKLGSFKYGYNATLGGDGKSYADYDLIYHLYQSGYNVKEIFFEAAKYLYQMYKKFNNQDKAPTAKRLKLEKNDNDDANNDKKKKKKCC